MAYRRSKAEEQRIRKEAHANAHKLSVVSPEKGKPNPAKGNKSKYDPKFCETIVDVARRGGSDAAMALACGVSSRKVIWTWRQKHPEFQTAYEYAKLVQLERDEALLDAFILGKLPKGNYKALEKRLQAMCPEKYGSNGLPNLAKTEINIHGNLNAIQSMGMEELDKKISEAMGRLGPLLEKEEEEKDEPRTIDHEAE